MAASTTSVPFLDLRSFEREDALAGETPSFSGVRSPFVSVYEWEAGAGSYDAGAREAYANLVHELQDEEFDEALFELATDARSLHQGQLAAGHSDFEAERVVTQHFSSLANEAEAAVDAMANEFARRADGPLAEAEVDSFVQEYVPSAPLAPAFENFFGKLLKKVSRAVKTVAGELVDTGELFRAPG